MNGLRSEAVFIKDPHGGRIVFVNAGKKPEPGSLRKGIGHHGGHCV